MKKYLAIFLLLLVAKAGTAQNDFDPEKLLKQRPARQELVNDFSGTLTPDQKQSLENKLVSFEDSTSVQIAVVIIPSLGGNDVSDYNVKLFRAWGVGNKKTNNGVVLLIAKNDRKLNITTGYGAEGPLPDVTSKHIIDEIIVPKFKGDDYYRGISDGTDAIMSAVKGEFTVPPSKHSLTSSPFIKLIPIVLFILFFIIFGGRGGGGSFMSRRGFAAWTIGNLLTGGGGGWGGGGSGGGGGGFGGFGGGSSGGGGASGSW